MNSQSANKELHMTQKAAHISKSDIAEAEQALSEAKNNLDDIRTRFAIQECPFEIGQRIKHFGRTHKDKLMVVDEIEPTPLPDDCAWVVYGRVIEADGTLSDSCIGFGESAYKRSIKEELANN